MSVHSGKNPFQCNKSQIFGRNGLRKKPFQCNICKWRFSEKSSLQSHVKHLQCKIVIHSGEKHFYT